MYEFHNPLSTLLIMSPFYDNSLPPLSIQVLLVLSLFNFIFLFVYFILFFFSGGEGGVGVYVYSIIYPYNDSIER